MEPAYLVTLVRILKRWVRRPVLHAFTLIELLVVVSIIIVITAIVLTGSSSFNRSIILTDTAYTVALSLREAQSFGLSSRTFNNRQTNVTYANTGYGVHFDRATPGSYLFFADVNPGTGLYFDNSGQCPGHTISDPNNPESRPGNCFFDGPTNTKADPEVVQQFTFSRGFTIVNFCGYSGSGSACSNTGALQAMDITFTRPNTNAVIIGILGNEFSANPSVASYTSACIQVQPQDNSASEYIRVTQLGQISIGATCP